MDTHVAEKESTTISMAVENAMQPTGDLFSRVHRINGYPWRLRLYWRTVYQSERCLSLICDKSIESELWECTATIKNPYSFNEVTHTFNSWHKHSQELFLASSIFCDDFSVAINIATKDVGNRWTLRSALESIEPRDGILVVGDEKKEIRVNQQSLAEQSPFFERLFYGDFTGMNVNKFTIGDVDYEEFVNIIKMVCGFTGSSLTDENVHGILQLADRFDLKIVEDRVVSYLLSSASFFSIHEKLLIADQYNLSYLKETLFSWYNTISLQELNESTEIQDLSFETLEALFQVYNDIDK